MERADAVIVGGGAAGLSAATVLSRQGFRVILLEARDRLGGRILTRHLPDQPLPTELGAEFIHGRSSEIFPLCDSAALLVNELPDDHVRVVAGRFERIADFWGDVGKVRGRIRGDRDRSFTRFLAAQKSLSPRLRKLALQFVEGYHAADPDRISALALEAGDEETEGGDANRQFRIADGYDALIAAMRTRLDASAELRLGTIVRRIEWDTTSVVVRSESAAAGKLEPIRASLVIVTVPAAVLRADRSSAAGIGIHPPIDELSKAIGKIETGPVAKVVLRFREMFWDDQGWLVNRSKGQKTHPFRPPNFLHPAEGAIQTWWTPAPARIPTITAWSGGPGAAALLDGKKHEVVERFLDALASLWSESPRRLARLVDRVDYHDWSRDPFSLGAYSYVAVGGREAQKRLSRPFERRIILAGEATDARETGTVSGAISSGKRAARQALDLLEV
jgi:monoamine oxidase